MRLGHPISFWTISRPRRAAAWAIAVALGVGGIVQIHAAQPLGLNAAFPAPSTEPPPADAVAWPAGDQPELVPSNASPEGPPAVPDSDVPYDEYAGWSTATDATDPWGWQVLPAQLIYRSYLAGNWEPRLGSEWNYTQDHGWLWDINLGGRQGILRYGSAGGPHPQGVQLDVEGAAITRLDFENELDVSATDYRAGIPLTWGRGRWTGKLAFYHLSSHLGDEFVLKNPGFPRINYSRNAFVLGNAWWWTDELRVYAEVDWAFITDGGSKPWGTQFGLEHVTSRPTGLRPAPFWAIHGHLREEVDWGGNLVVQAGWLWRSDLAGRLFRVGMDYYNGKSRQLSLFHTFEQQVGMGVWYDY